MTVVGVGGRILRIGVVVGTLAAVLVPAWIAPARTISFPETLAETVALGTVHAKRVASARSLEFAPTHIAFSWSGAEEAKISYREAGEDRWRVAPIAHDADTAARHYTGVMSVDRPDAIEWRAVAPPDGTITGLTLDYMNTLDGPQVKKEVPAVAGARPRTPDIVTRAEWGADESLKRTSGGCRRRFFPVQQLFVHHTAGSNFDNNPKATMRAIYHYHVVRQGWCDIGYNFVVSYDGTIFEGRWARSYDPWETHDSENKGGEPVVGAHVDGFNSGTVGISVMGNFQTARPSPATRRALAELLAWEVDRHDLRARGNHSYRNPETGSSMKLPWIAGHRDADSTSCPGDRLFAALPDVRRDAEAVIAGGKASTKVSLSSSTRRVTYGEDVTIAGSLSDEDGVPLGGRTIRTYVRKGDRAWKPGPQTTTTPDGSFALTLSPAVNTRVAAIYYGDGRTWGSEAEARVKVSPIVTLAADGATVDESGVYHFGPGTQVIPFVGNVTPPKGGHPVKVQVSKLQSDGSYVRVGRASGQIDREGGFVVNWDVVDPGIGGTYNAHALLPKDDDHARGISPTITVVIDPQP